MRPSSCKLSDAPVCFPGGHFPAFCRRLPARAAIQRGTAVVRYDGRGAIRVVCRSAEIGSLAEQQASTGWWSSGGGPRWTGTWLKRSEAWPLSRSARSSTLGAPPHSCVPAPLGFSASFSRSRTSRTARGACRPSRSRRPAEGASTAPSSAAAPALRPGGA